MVDSFVIEEQEAAWDDTLAIKLAVEEILLRGEIELDGKATRTFARIKTGSEVLTALIDGVVISIVYERGFG